MNRTGQLQPWCRRRSMPCTFPFISSQFSSPVSVSVATMAAVLTPLLAQLLTGLAGKKAKNDTSAKQRKAPKQAKPQQAISKKPRRNGKKTNAMGAATVMNTQSTARASIASAPATTGVVSFNKRGTTKIRVPFSSLSNSQLMAGYSGSAPTPIQFAVSSSTTTFGYDLNPIGNAVGGLQNTPFGVGVSNVAHAYARWRLAALRVTYVPTVATQTPGVVILGATTEDYLVNTPTPQNVSDCQVSMTTPVWQTAEMNCQSLLDFERDTWFYVYIPANTVAEQRQEYQLSLLASSLGNTNTAIATYGYLRFDGVIEFESLSDIVGGVNARRFSQPRLATNSPAEADTPETTKNGDDRHDPLPIQEQVGPSAQPASRASSYIHVDTPEFLRPNVSYVPYPQLQKSTR
jgi:hypothetical protein